MSTGLIRFRFAVSVSFADEKMRQILYEMLVIGASMDHKFEWVDG
jgi:hypothetical protein